MVVAVKKLRAVKLPPGLDKAQTTKKLLRLKHSNVAPLLGFTFNEEIAIISPWFNHGNVSDYLATHPGADRMRLVQGVAAGLEHLHSSSPVVVHGDMKPDNVLIDQLGCPRIIDFGLSKIVEEDPSLSSIQSASLREAGNARWIAPELLLEEGASRSRQTDMYSFGCVALFMFTGDVPFKGTLDGQLVIARYKGASPIHDGATYPNLNTGSALMEVLRACWNTNPRARPRIGEVVKLLNTTHPGSTPSEPAAAQQEQSTTGKRRWVSFRRFLRRIFAFGRSKTLSLVRPTMLKRTAGILSGLFKGQKQPRGEGGGPTAERLDDPSRPTDPYPDVTLVFGFEKSATKISVNSQASTNDTKPLPDIPLRAVPAEPGPLPSRDARSLGWGSSPKNMVVPKTHLDAQHANDSTTFTLSSEAHKDPARLRPQSEDRKHIKQPLPTDSIERAVLRPAFSPTSAFGTFGSLLAADQADGAHPSYPHDNVDSGTSLTPLSNPTHRATPESTASRKSSNLVRQLPSASRGDLSDLQSIHAGWLPYSEGIPPAPDEEVGEMRWVKFITLVDGQQGHYRSRRTTAIACGGFSDVWKCDARFSDGSHVVVAVKKLRAVNMPDDLGALEVAERLLKRLNKEIRIWMALRHPNIAPLIGFTFSGEVCVISPWFSNGNVGEYLQRNPDTDRLRLIRQVASGVAYLHNRKPVVVHGDLKHDNVLIDRDGNPRIIDFGLSKAVEEEPGLASLSSTSLREAGRGRWMAPELLMEEGVSRSCSTDVFSFACVAFFILTGDIPFKGMSDVQVYFAWFKGSHPIRRNAAHPELDAQPELKSVLFSCWEKDPETRPGMAAVAHALQTLGHSSQSPIRPSL
ncbi:hypothetical protein FRC05_005760 [Tulasnella sp. 425]|nr:hypothetical protein FRC05_005760 [Tulasnella sp. 425]